MMTIITAKDFFCASSFINLKVSSVMCPNTYWNIMTLTVILTLHKITSYKETCHRNVWALFLSQFEAFKYLSLSLHTFINHLHCM